MAELAKTYVIKRGDYITVVCQKPAWPGHAGFHDMEGTAFTVPAVSLVVARVGTAPNTAS